MDDKENGIPGSVCKGTGGIKISPVFRELVNTQSGGTLGKLGEVMAGRAEGQIEARWERALGVPKQSDIGQRVFQKDFSGSCVWEGLK